MDLEFNEAESIKCKYHPQRAICMINCKQNFAHPSRLVCSQCVMKYQTLDGFSQVQDVLSNPMVMLRARDWERKEYGIYHSICDYFDLLEQDPDEYIKIFTKDILLQIQKLEHDLKEGIEKYKLFRAEIAKIYQQFNEVFRFAEFKQTFKDILKVESYHFDSQKNKLEETVQNFILQFKDQNNQKSKEAYEKLKTLEKNLSQNAIILPKVMTEFQSDLQRNTLKSIELLSQQLFNLWIFKNQSKLCDPIYFCQLIQRIKNYKKEEPKITLIFKASEHGMNAQAFWAKCSNQGPTLTICKSKNGYVFGGYSPCKWVPGNASWQKDESISSFLFSYTRKEIYPILSVDHAIYCYQTANYGPTFGGNHNLHIAADFQSGHSKMTGQYYSNETYKIENQLLIQWEIRHHSQWRWKCSQLKNELQIIERDGIKLNFKDQDISNVFKVKMTLFQTSIIKFSGSKLQELLFKISLRFTILNELIIIQNQSRYFLKIAHHIYNLNLSFKSGINKEFFCYHAIYCNNSQGPTFGRSQSFIAADFQNGSNILNNNYYSNQSYNKENQNTHLMGVRHHSQWRWKYLQQNEGIKMIIYQLNTKLLIE